MTTKSTKKKTVKEITKEICGQEMDLYFDKKTPNLNIELAVKNGAPIINLERWTRLPQTPKMKKENNQPIKSTVLLTLHLHEAIELKAAIDSLILDATLFHKEYIDELMVNYIDTGNVTKSYEDMEKAKVKKAQKNKQ